MDLSTHENEAENLNLKNIATEVVLPCQNDPLIKFSKVVNESKNKVLRLFGSEKTCLMEIKQPIQQRTPENFSNLQECLGDDFKKILA